MKKRILALLLAALILTCCAASAYTVLDTGEIWIPLTEESAAYREKVREAQENLFLSEAYYPTLLEELLNRTGEQAFPEVETVNTLNVSEYNGEKVYTLDDGDWDCIVMFLHGGAYAFEIDAMHVAFCDKLVSRLNAKVYMPIYPLAPQATYKEAYALLDALYPELVAQDMPIYIMGDSAGGGFTLAYTEYLKANGGRLPDKLVALSPWTDITMSNPDIPEYEAKDLTLAAYAPEQIGKLWAGELDTKDPLVSPLYGDLEGMPPILLFLGTDEIMVPDVELFYSKLKALGQEVTLVYGEGLWHVFPVSDIPEAAESIDLIVDFIGADAE